MHSLLKKIKELLKLAEIERRWHRVARVFAIAVVFCTTYMLILPAITMENETYCGIEEHTHEDDCWQVRDVLICNLGDVSTATDAISLDNEHIHSDACYEKQKITVCGLSEHIHSDYCLSEELANREKELLWEQEKEEYIASLDETILSSLEGLSEEEKNKVLDVICAIELKIPTTDEFYQQLDLYYYSDDPSGEEEYYLKVQNNAVSIYAYYQGFSELEEYIINKDKLFAILDLFDNMPQTYTTGTSSAVTFNYINYTWTTVAPVVIHGGSLSELDSSKFGMNAYWHGIAVDYNSDEGYYYVSDKYAGGSDTSSSSKVYSIKASTSKGFVIFIWMADTSATTLQKTAAEVAVNVEIGDRVTVSADPTATSSGSYKSSGYGTVTFSEYVPPAVESEEDLEWYKDTAEESDSQVADGGGRVTSADGNIVTTKTINGTDIENVFDITLTVETQSNIQTFLNEPDMAVVIVLDVSNTMNTTFTNDTMSRYDAAVTAASEFIEHFAGKTSGLSQIGFVAFNTHAHEIFELQPCATQEQATALISEMETDTYSIVKASGYSKSHDRFTNVEGGIKRAYDMLEKSGNSNQYIVLLTDGFPTTYLVDNSDDSTNYNGYDPYTSSGTVGQDGVFHDDVLGVYCTGGTSYSDKASVKARVMADKIKSNGAKIFSVGVDVAGQKIQTYINAAWSTGSVVDRTSTTYEIGDASSTEAYKNWLGNSIGSGYYYDSTDQDGIDEAFEEIFNEIIELNNQTTKTVWTASDPMPVYDEEPGVVGFVHFYDKDGNAVASPDDPESLTGDHVINGENTAVHEDSIIRWDLKKSGYTSVTEGSVTTYYYKLKYRVRLVNEKDTEKPFVDSQVYETNGEAYLEYRSVTTTNGVEEISDLKTVSFSKPAVFGYLSELTFTKQDGIGNVLDGAEFTLTHAENCNKCHGDGTSLTDYEAHEENYVQEHYDHQLGPYVAYSNSEGVVTFERIPSGHSYILEETSPPEGYTTGKSTYSVVVAYDVLTVYETENGVTKQWNGINDVIRNYGYVLPATGGSGTTGLYIIGGLLTIMSSVFLLCKCRNNRGRRRKGSEA